MWQRERENGGEVRSKRKRHFTIDHLSPIALVAVFASLVLVVMWVLLSVPIVNSEEDCVGGPRTIVEWIEWSGECANDQQNARTNSIEAHGSI